MKNKLYKLSLMHIMEIVCIWKLLVSVPVLKPEQTLAVDKN
jgi:hypothetical protein